MEEVILNQSMADLFMGHICTLIMCIHIEALTLHRMSKHILWRWWKQNLWEDLFQLNQKRPANISKTRSTTKKKDSTMVQERLKHRRTTLKGLTLKFPTFMESKSSEGLKLDILRLNFHKFLSRWTIHRLKAKNIQTEDCEWLIKFVFYFYLSNLT